MKPKPKEKIVYEKVSTDDFAVGEIAEVQYEEAHTFSKGGPHEKQGEAVRFKFALDGYKFPHYSRWMYFSYGEKSTLFLKYIVSLVKDAAPDLDLDIQILKDLRVRTLWQEKDGFQSVETIRPVEGKILVPQAPGVAEAKETQEKIKEAMAEETTGTPGVTVGHTIADEIAKEERIPTGNPETEKAIGETINKMADMAEEKPEEEVPF